MKPICSWPYPVSKVNEDILKKEVGCLVLLGVLEVANDSECRSPSFAQPKSKSDRVIFLIDVRNLIKQLKQKPYPIQKINEMLVKL